MRTSESIKHIASALVAFQSEISNPKHTAENPFYNSKYTPLQDLISHIRPVLAKHKLAVLQNPYSEDGQAITVVTRIIHESGEWLETSPLTMRADKLTPQGSGAALTYARRYSLAAALGIASEDDDDANSLEPPGTQTQEKPKQRASGYISHAQAKRMFAIAGGNADIVRLVLAEYGIVASNQVPKSVYNEICDKIQILVAEAKEGANNESS